MCRKMDLWSCGAESRETWRPRADEEDVDVKLESFWPAFITTHHITTQHNYSALIGHDTLTCADVFFVQLSFKPKLYWEDYKTCCLRFGPKVRAAFVFALYICELWQGTLLCHGRTFFSIKNIWRFFLFLKRFIVVK